MLLVVALIAVIYKRAGKRAAVYRLPQPWIHAPILWSAVDEPIAGESVLTVGGGASGRW